MNMWIIDRNNALATIASAFDIRRPSKYWICGIFMELDFNFYFIFTDQNVFQAIYNLKKITNIQSNRKKMNSIESTKSLNSKSNWMNIF